MTIMVKKFDSSGLRGANKEARKGQIALKGLLTRSGGGNKSDAAGETSGETKKDEGVRTGAGKAHKVA